MVVLVFDGDSFGLCLFGWLLVFCLLFWRWFVVRFRGLWVNTLLLTYVLFGWCWFLRFIVFRGLAVVSLFLCVVWWFVMMGGCDLVFCEYIDLAIWLLIWVLLGWLRKCVALCLRFVCLFWCFCWLVWCCSVARVGWFIMVMIVIMLCWCRVYRYCLLDLPFRLCFNFVLI